MKDILLKHILLYDFFNDLDAQSNFDNNLVTKKTVKLNHSYLKCALASANEVAKNKKAGISKNRLYSNNALNTDISMTYFQSFSALKKFGCARARAQFFRDLALALALKTF